MYGDANVIVKVTLNRVKRKTGRMSVGPCGRSDGQLLEQSSSTALFSGCFLFARMPHKHDTRTMKAAVDSKLIF